MNAQTNKRGFTIIEVVLVLAIAALIFLMVFIALPALQRGQRDTARKQDVGTVASAINTYRSNHRGSLPDVGYNLSTDKYLDKLSQVDPGDVSIAKATNGAAAPAVDAIKVYTAGACKDDNTVQTGTNRQAAVVTTLENGGVYCQDV